VTVKICSGCSKPAPREWCWSGLQRGCPMGMPPRYTDPPSITCPVCGMTSYNLTDIEMGYCGNCHGYTSPVDPVMKAANVLREAQAGARITEPVRSPEDLGEDG